MSHIWSMRSALTIMRATQHSMLLAGPLLPPPRCSHPQQQRPAKSMLAVPGHKASSAGFGVSLALACHTRTSPLATGAAAEGPCMPRVSPFLPSQLPSSPPWQVCARRTARQLAVASSSDTVGDEAAVEIEVEEQDPTQPPPRLKVEHETRSVDLETLLSRAKKGIINLKPRYQRGYVWSKQKAYRLVESVLAGLFVPAIVTHAKSTSNGEVEDVVDGKQRLTTLLAFKEGVFPDGTEFRLQGLTELPELNGKTYSDLEESGAFPSRYSFDSQIISCAKFRSDTRDEAVLRVYEDLNCGSESLNKQKIRRAVFGGPYVDLLEQLASYGKFLRIRAANQNALDESDQELILRFFMLNRRSRSQVGFTGTIHRGLDKEISNHRHLDTGGDTEENLGSLFTSTIDLVWEVYGDIAFRRMTDKGVEKDINAGLYDSIMLTFAELCIDTHKEAKQRKQQVIMAGDALRDSVKLLCNEEEFRTNRFSAARLRARLDLYGRHLDTVVQKVVEERKKAPRPVSRTFDNDKALRIELFDSQKQKCALCGSTIHRVEDAELDHKIPYSRGGASEKSNAQLVHRFCNQRKSNRSDAEAVQRMLGPVIASE